MHENSVYSYSLGVRLSHLVSILLLAALYATGLRLTWLAGEVSPLFQPEPVIDSLVPTGLVHIWHVRLGLTFLCVGVFYISQMVLTGQLGRLTNLFTHRRYDYRKKLFYLWMMVFSLLLIVSGITLYTGLYEGPDGYRFIKLVHRYCSISLLILIAVHALDVFVGKGSKVNSIFFSYQSDRFVYPKALLLSAIITLVFGVGIAGLVTTPAALVSEYLDRQAIIDGQIRETEWDGARALVLRTSGGSNFENGVSEVAIRSFHNRAYIYFLVQWTDKDRSLNRHLEKADSGWIERVSEYVDLFGESIYWEDKAALSFHRQRSGCTGTCHVHPPGKMGLHYTGGDTVDVWEWQAVSTNPVGQAEDLWWGEYKNGQVGGRQADNLAAGGSHGNLNPDWQQPYFLPGIGSSRNWILLASDETAPYLSDNDTFSIGGQVPAVLLARLRGDRGDVSACGRWRDGIWTVEFSRRLKTGSLSDLDMKGELYLGIALFDNTASRHAYHLRPIKLIVK